MDNNGIFKIIDMAMKYLTKDKDTKNGDTLKSPLESIANLFNNKNEQKCCENDNKSPQQKPVLEQKPLQNQMLFTMKSHDEFVKRVKKQK